MAPRPNVSEERTTQILDAAAAVFARLGFHQARMDDIAQQAGVSKGALYLYFKSKDAIITAILRHLFAGGLHNLHALRESEDAVTEQLLAFTRQISAEMERLTIMLPIAFEFYAIAARQKAVRQFLKEYYREFREVLATLLQRGIDRGELRPVDATTAANTILALFEGLNVLWITDPAAIQVNEAVEASVRLLLEGLRMEKPSAFDTRPSA